MAFRFPTPKILTEEQGKLMGWISNFKPADVKVKVENNKGEEALIGPFAPYYYSPATIEPFFQLGRVVQGLDFSSEAMRNSGISNLKVMEIGIHAVLSKIDAPFISVAHRDRALSAGITEEQIESMKDGKTPDNFTKEEQALYELSVAIAGVKAPIEAAVFKKFAEALSKEQIAAMTHLIGSYTYLAMLENINDALVNFES